MKSFKSFVSFFLFFPFLALSQQIPKIGRDIEMPPSKDSITSIFYDKMTGVFYRYFYNKTDAVEQGFLKFPRDGEDEIHTTKLYACGVLDEHGKRYFFGHNENLISICGNVAVTFVHKHYTGKTIAKSYKINDGRLVLQDTLHFETPFVCGYSAFDGEYVFFNEGEDVNVNFLVFKRNLKYVCTYSPFYSGYYSFKIISDEDNLMLATASMDSVKIAYFDKQFKLYKDEKIKLKPRTDENEVPGFGGFVGFGKTLLFTKIVRKNNDNIMLTSAYNRQGEFLWEKDYVPRQGMDFIWNKKTGQMFALLFKNKKPYIGLFDEVKGHFIDSLNYEDYYNKLYPAKEKNIMVRAMCAKWLDDKSFIFVFGEMKRKGPNAVGYIDNVSMLMKGSTSSIISQNILAQPLKGVSAVSANGKLRLSTFKNIIEYEK